jgi:hypothetical protein
MTPSGTIQGLPNAEAAEPVWFVAENMTEYLTEHDARGEIVQVGPHDECSPTKVKPMGHDNMHEMDRWL